MVQILLGLAGAAAARRRRRRRRAGAVPPRHAPLPCAARRSERGDDRVAARHAARTVAVGEVLVEVAGVGYRVSVTPRTLGSGRAGQRGLPLHPPPRPRGRGHPLRLHRPATSARASRRCSAPTVWARRSRWRSCRCTRPSPAPAVAADDARALCLVPGVGKKTAARLLIELKARLDVPELDLAAVQRLGAGARRGHAGAGRRARRARRARLRPRRGPRRDARSPTTATTRPRCYARRCSVWPRCAAMRDELLEPDARPTTRTSRSRSACGPARSTSSSARPSSRSTSASSSRRPAGAGQAADHLLFAGPPGLGKTTLAGIVADRDGRAPPRHLGPALERAGDLAAILTKLDEGDVLFIDEIHRLVARRRGGPLPRDGGLPARHRARARARRRARSASTCPASRSSAPPPAPG